MARITNVQHAQKATKCGRCGVTIAAKDRAAGVLGDPYRWAKPRAGKFARGAKLVRCMATTCNFRPSEMTSSKMGTIYDAQEEFGLTGEASVGDIRSALEEFAGVVNEVAQEYRDSASNIEEGFGHTTSQSEELESKADDLEGWAEEVGNVALEELESEYDGLEYCRDVAIQAITCAMCREEFTPEKWEGLKECPGDDCGADSGEDRLDSLREEAQELADEQVQACPV